MALKFLNNGYFAGKVGIGVEDPGASLEIGNLIADAAGLKISSPGSEVNVNFSFIIGDTSLSLHPKNLVIKGSSGSSDIAFSPSSSYPALMVLDGSAGNVGIGATSPNHKLHVRDNTVTNGTGTLLELQSQSITNGGSLNLDFRVSSAESADRYVARISGVREGNGALSQLQFWTESSGLNQRMTILSGGNVGIGTDSPDSKLHVAKNGNANGGSILMGEKGNGTNKWSYLAGTHYDQDTGSTNGTGSAGVALIGSLATETYNKVLIGGNPYELNAATQIEFWTHSSTLSTQGGTQRGYVNSGGDWFLANTLWVDNADSKVGIGTTSPGATLDVRHDAGGTVRIGTDTNNIGEDAAFGTLEFYNGDTSNSGPGVTAMIQAKTYNQYSTGGDITFSNKIYPSGTIAERMRIDSDGKVGIGTTSPSVTLELNSDTGNAAKLKIGRQNGATNYLELGTSGGSSVINAIGIAGVNADLIFNRSTTTATTQSMIINGSGNVGIGTSNFADMSWATPALKLLGSRAGLGLYSTGDLATLAFTSNADGTKAVHINQASSGKISFYQYSQGSETLTLDNTGFLGVNTTLPSARLHVTGTAKITDLPYSPFGEMVTVSSAGQLTKKTSSSGGNYFADMSFGESYISNYKSRVLDYNGTYFPTAAASNVANHKANNLFNLITMMLLPGGVFTGKITAAKPKTGVDFTWTRTTVANYTDEEGVIQEAAIATPRIDYANNSNGEILIEPTRTNIVPNSGPGVYGNGPGSSTTVPGPNGVYDSAIVPVPDAAADRYQYTIPSGTYSNGDVFTYSWYRRRLSTPVQNVFVGDLSIQGLVNCSLTGATTQIESNISGFDRFACEITLTLANTNALVRGYFGAIVGIGNSSVAYFGQQLELGDFATTLINTTGSAVTRDNDYMIVNNLSGTIFQGMVGQGGFYMDFDYKRAGNADGLRFYDEDNITPRVYLYQGVTGISDGWNAGSFTLNQTSGNKIGYMFTSTTSAVYCANGSNIVTSSPTAAQALNTPLDTIYIDGNQNLVRIRELSMFTQMTSAQLVTLTTS